MMSSDNSSRPAYKSALSEESSLATVESDIYNLDVKAEVAKYRRRRRATILAIVAIFATAGAILIFSVVHDLQSRPEFEYEDYVCAESDKVCMENLCPRGHDWNSQLQVCQIKSGNDLQQLACNKCQLYSSERTLCTCVSLLYLQDAGAIL